MENQKKLLVLIILLVSGHLSCMGPAATGAMFRTSRPNLMKFDSFKREFDMLKTNPSNFFMIKESKDYMSKVRANGFKWEDFKGFAYTPTGKIFIATNILKKLAYGYVCYQGYKYAKKSEDEQSAHDLSKEMKEEVVVKDRSFEEMLDFCTL